MIKIQNPWLRSLLILFAFSLIYFYYSGMYPWDFAHRLAGDITGDMSQFFWSSFHLEEWIHGRQDFFYTDLIFTPYGTNLYLHTYSHILAVVCYVVGNKFLGANLVLWLHYIFSGLGACLLARQFKLPWYWSFVAGFVFAFAPYKFMHYNGHYNLQQTAFIPFFILYFFRAFPIDAKEKLFSKLTPKLALTLFIFGTLSLLSSYVYATFLFFFVVGYFIYYAYYKFLPSMGKRVVVLALLTIIVSFMVPWLHKMGIEDHGGFWWCDDFAKYLTPNWNNTFYHAVLPKIYDNYAHLEIKNGDGFLGFLIPLLVIIVTVVSFIKVSKNKTPKVLLYMSLFFFMLTLPEVIIFKTKLFYFPTSIYHFIPIINNLRIPDRFVIMLALFLPIFLFTTWENYLGSKKNIPLIPIIIFCVLFIEFHQRPIEKAKRKDIPQWAKTLSELPPGNLLPLPTGVNDGNRAEGYFGPNHLYYQTIHKHKIVGGYVSRITDVLRAKFRSDPVMNEILERSADKKHNLRVNESLWHEFRTNYEIQYILINKRDNRFDDLLQVVQKIGVRDTINTATHYLYQLP